MTPALLSVISQRLRNSAPLITDDWVTRSTASGVVKASRLDSTLPAQGTPSPAAIYVLTNGNQAAVSLDTSIKSGNSAGSQKFAELNSDGADSGDLAFYFGDVATFGNGATAWFSYRMHAPASEVYQPWPTSGGATQAKRSIFSRSTGSNQVNEIVVVIGENAGTLGGYHQDGSAFPPIEDPAVTACSGSDFKFQPAIDHGANPLTGNDPDTGSAWSSCAQDRARYGLLYAAKSLGQFRTGFGDPLTGGFRAYPDEWITVTCRVVVGHFGSSDNRWTLWAARDGQAYVKVFDESGLLLGAGPDYDTLWLLPYVTSRVAGGTSVSSRTSNITGAEILVTGLSTPTGDGTLEYVASTGLFRWKGAGEAFGTARGFSSANGILTINVTSGTATDSYVVVRITPALLPSSGTTTDTVTITNVRAATQYNVADVIISSQSINAPGGFAPVG